MTVMEDVLIEDEGTRPEVRRWEMSTLVEQQRMSVQD